MALDIQNMIRLPVFSAYSGTIWFVVQLIFYLGVVGGGFWWWWRKYKIYNIVLEVWEVGNNKSFLIGVDRGHIRAKKNDMRLYYRKLMLPIPPREAFLPTKSGAWKLVLYKFGEKDYTYVVPAISADGFELKATDSFSRKWATITLKEEMEKLKKEKWYNNPLLTSVMTWIFIVIITYIVMSNLSAVSSVCSAVAPECTKAAQAASNCMASAGQFYQTGGV